MSLLTTRVIESFRPSAAEPATPCGVDHSPQPLPRSERRLELPTGGNARTKQCIERLSNRYDESSLRFHFVNVRSSFYYPFNRLGWLWASTSVSWSLRTVSFALMQHDRVGKRRHEGFIESANNAGECQPPSNARWIPLRWNETLQVGVT